MTVTACRGECIWSGICAERHIDRQDRAQKEDVNRLRTVRDAGTAFLRAAEIRDTGEGVAPENLAKVFDPFFTTKDPGRGTGLGLAISARIIDTFGGRITLESTPGEGAAFILWLPLAGRKNER
jgi:signal transduction histidine kinase